LKDFSKDLSNTVSEAYLVGLFPGFLDSDFWTSTVLLEYWWLQIHLVSVSSQEFIGKEAGGDGENSTR
jgi:hypothetical protein